MSYKRRIIRFGGLPVKPVKKGCLFLCSIPPIGGSIRVKNLISREHFESICSSAFGYSIGFRNQFYIFEYQTFSVHVKCDLNFAEPKGIKAITEAIRQGILVNPRGMEPLGAKGMFEVLTGKFGHQMSDDTTRHTPWTRQFYPCRTTGPDGELIEDLVAWTTEHWEELVLKPAHSYSAHGVFVG